MDERAIFDEKREMKQANFSCSYCGQRDMYDVQWLTRRKKNLNPKNMNERDRAQFEKSRDYMIRIDDTLNCKNARCRKRFEIPTAQSVVFI
jgi:aspartate carbamoyltransferase regulatory subunit